MPTPFSSSHPASCIPQLAALPVASSAAPPSSVLSPSCLCRVRCSRPTTAGPPLHRLSGTALSSHLVSAARRRRRGASPPYRAVDGDSQARWATCTVRRHLGPRGKGLLTALAMTSRIAIEMPLGGDGRRRLGSRPLRGHGHGIRRQSRRIKMRLAGWRRVPDGRRRRQRWPVIGGGCNAQSRQLTATQGHGQEHVDGG